MAGLTWTKEEEQILITNAHLDIPSLIELIPNRTAGGIRDHKSKLGLRRKNNVDSRIEIQEQQGAFILEYSKKFIPIKQISLLFSERFFKISEQRIRYFLMKNNISCNSPKIDKILTNTEQIDFILKCYDEHPSVLSITNKWRIKYGKIATKTIQKILLLNNKKVFNYKNKPPHHLQQKISLKQQLLGIDINFDKYQNYGKLKFLSQVYTKAKLRSNQYIGKQVDFQQFIDHFYNDINFNKIYDNWINSNQHRFYYPSLDHKVPLSRDGGWELQNLQFITWLENRAKYDMTLDEWLAFKKQTNTSSDLFLC